jgi:hypothetical protein
VTVTTSDGTNPTTEKFVLAITTVCGPDSTVITPPTLDALEKASVTAENSLRITDAQFEVSNGLCPITSYTVTPNDGTFDLTANVPTFTIALSDAKSSIEGEYPYTIGAAAQGGATAEASSTMTVFNACKGEVIPGFEDSFTVALPPLSAGSSTATIISSGAAYAPVPFPGCT